VHKFSDSGWEERTSQGLTAANRGIHHCGENTTKGDNGEYEAHLRRLRVERECTLVRRSLGVVMVVIKISVPCRIMCALAPSIICCLLAGGAASSLYRRVLYRVKSALP
jgi:hypothetical protein